MDKSTRILIADDHTIVRQGLARLLNDQPDLKVVGEAVNGRQAVDKALELKPEIIIRESSPMFIASNITERSALCL